MANLNNISKEIKIGTQTIKASITREDVAGLYAQCGIDVEAALENILASELTAANFEKFAAGITAQNREGKLNSILESVIYYIYVKLWRFIVFLNKMMLTGFNI